MNKKTNQTVTPKLRFPEFNKVAGWQKSKIRKYLKESRILGSKGDQAKKITVKLWGNGVFEKQEALQGSSNTQYFKRKEGQFIYSKLDFLNQAFGIIPKHLDNFESTVDLPCFDISDEVVPEFFLEYVQRKDFFKKYGELADGGRKAKRIQVVTFLSFPIFLPKKDEQQRIADCLASVDDQISEQAQKLDALKDHKTGLMQKLFPCEGGTTPVLRFPEFQYEKEWQNGFLNELSDIVRGGSPRPINAYLTTDLNGLNWLKIGDVSSDSKYITQTQEKVVREALCKTRLIRPGDLILSNSMSFGRPFISQIEACIHDGWIAIRSINRKICIDYLYYYISSSIPQKYFLINAAGAAVKNLNADIIKLLPIVFPDINEQKKIATCLSSLDEQISFQAQRIDALKAHKRGLIQKLFPSVEKD